MEATTPTKPTQEVAAEAAPVITKPVTSPRIVTNTGTHPVTPISEEKDGVRSWTASDGDTFSVESWWRNVFITNIPLQSTEQTLLEQLPYTPVKHNLIRRKAFFGFLLFETHEQACETVSLLDGAKYPNSPYSLLCKFADEQPVADKTKDLQIEPIPEGIEPDSLRDLFNHISRVTDVMILPDPRNQKDVGFVTFENPEAAEKAREVFNGKSPLTRRPLTITFAAPKEVRERTIRRQTERPISATARDQSRNGPYGRNDRGGNRWNSGPPQGGYGSRSSGPPPQQGGGGMSSYAATLGIAGGSGGQQGGYQGYQPQSNYNSGNYQQQW